MKEIDDTPVPESESEDPIGVIDQHTRLIWEALDGLSERIEVLAVRIANLETRRTLQADPNDDEEWY
jgi:hypothetical protein